MNGNVTRSFFTLKASASAIKVVEGTPTIETVETDTWISPKDNDLAMAKRMLKSINRSISLDTVKITVVNKEVRAMTNDAFYDASTPVTRAANGRVS